MSPADHTPLTEVVQPSLQDHEDTLKKLSERKRSLDELLSSASPQMAKENLEVYRGQVEKIALNLDACQESIKGHATFGEVFAASGFRLSSQNMELDWALLKIPPDRVGTNKVCSQEVINMQYITNTV